MRDLQQNSWPGERAGAGWAVRLRPGHPLVAGALCLALAVGAWYGLLWGFRQTPELGASAPGRIAPAQEADTQPPPETRRVVLGRRTPPSLPRVPAAPRGSSKPSVSKILSDSAPQPKVSPFRRSHPWAASSGGQHYYPSSCPATLRLPDLVFFRSEAEARAGGFTPSRLSGCE
jgi:hypothetical protein